MSKECSNTSCSKESCEGCPSKSSLESMQEPANAGSRIKKVIGVVSGKGGVGKSMVTATLASLMNKKGYKTGILDGDITGPSIPKMFGVNDQLLQGELGIFPANSKGGVEMISINLLLEKEDDPVILRGPIIAGTVKQFWTDVTWGDLDYLFVDMPPGTGDVPLTVFQSLPVDGILIVTSPQDLVSMIVKKAYHMADKMNISVIGIIENYSYLECPDCKKRINVFGESKIDEIAQSMNLSVLGRIPIRPEFAQLADDGRYDEVENECLEAAIVKLEDLL